MNRFYSLLLTLVTLSCVWAAELPRIAIVDVQTHGLVDRSAADHIKERLSNLLEKREGFSVLPFQQTKKKMFDKNILVPTRCDGACFQGIGKKLELDYVVQAMIEKNQDQMSFQILVTDVLTGQKVSDAKVWSDGRVSQALASALNESLSFIHDRPVEEKMPLHYWIAGGVGVALSAVFMGLWVTNDPLDRDARRFDVELVVSKDQP